MQRLGLVPPCGLEAVGERDDDRVDFPRDRNARKKVKTETTPGSVRRSSRLRMQGGGNAEVMQHLDYLNDEEQDWDLAVAGRRRKKRSATGEDAEDIYARALADSRKWLQQSRTLLLRLPQALEKETSGEHKAKWRDEARQRWGDRVPEVPDFEKYVRSRLAKPPPPSPLELLQEFYAFCPWRLLVCCGLMSRVSSKNCSRLPVTSALGYCH